MMSDKIGLNPIWIIISIILGSQIAGFVGLLIAVPIASVIKRIANDFKNQNSNAQTDYLETNTVEILENS